MYQALQLFSPPALYNRLVSAVGEALEESLLDERVGRDGGRGVGEF